MVSPEPSTPVARLFSTAAFREFLATGDERELQTRTECVRDALGLEGQLSNHDVLIAAYDFLQHTRKTEYYYKNLLANKIWLARHRTSATLLYELKVAGSIADSVLLGKQDGVYEIKSERDSPRKLQSQITSYYKAFTRVTVVCNINDGDAYLADLEGSAVGVVAATPRGALRVLSPASTFKGGLDLPSMFKILRQSEVESIVYDWFGELPIVPSGRKYSSLLDWSQEIPLLSYHEAMHATLKSRGRGLHQHIANNPSYFPLRALLLQLAPQAQSIDRLNNWMSRKAT